MTRGIRGAIAVLFVVVAHCLSHQLQGSVKQLPLNPVNNAITCCEQDSDGFMWIGTYYGLLRYDGYTYKNFPDVVPVCNSTIRTIYSDDEGRLWIGTSNGAIAYIIEENQFVELNGIAGGTANGFLKIPTGEILATSDKGVFIIDPETYTTSLLKSQEYPALEVKGLHYPQYGPDGSVWVYGQHELYNFTFTSKGAPPTVTRIGTRNPVISFAVSSVEGLIWYSDGDGLYSLHYTGTSWKERIVASDITVRILKYTDGKLWIGTGLEGVHVMETDPDGTMSGKQVVWMDERNHADISNMVNHITPDRDGNMWIGTLRGIFMLEVVKQHFFMTISEDNSALSNNMVADVKEGPDGYVWASTINGLNRILFSDEGPRIRTYYNKYANMTALDNVMQALDIDSHGKLWVGTKKGIVMFDPSTEKFHIPAAIDGMMSELRGSFAKSVFADPNDRIWIGLLFGGVIIYDTDRDLCFNLVLEGLDIFNADVRSLTFDRDGGLWLGTGKYGVIHILSGDINFNNITRYNVYGREMGLKGGLESNIVNEVICTRAGSVYAGTSVGLFIYNPVAGEFMKIPLNPMIRSEYVSSITEDKAGHLWVDTPPGIFRYDPATSQSAFYELNDTLNTQIDYVSGSTTGHTGVIFKGGISGVTFFDPDKVKPDMSAPYIYVSDFSIHNTPVAGSGEYFSGNLASVTDITLSHSENQFSFEFTTLEYNNPGKTRYSYMLEGLDKQWVFLDNNRNYITYSNLHPGKYTLRIRSTNNSGVLCDVQRHINITIRPPWWATWWSYTIYTTLVFALLYFVFRYISDRYKHHQKESLSHWKQQFFIKVTHSFKTPLTMLQLPLDTLSESGQTMDEQEKQTVIDLMSKNVARISSIVSQLTEFHRIDNKSEVLNLAQVDMVAFSKSIAMSNMHLFRSKDITFEFESDRQQVMATCDPDKIETVIFNLLLNACKFTHEGGKVTLRCHAGNNKVYVSVTDTGIGISKMQQKNIFRRFWQNNPSGDDNIGMGLSLSYDLVELHQGNMSVDSEFGSGTTFSFWLHLGEDHFGSSKYLSVREDYKFEPKTLPPVSIESLNEMTYTSNKNSRKVMVFSMDNDFIIMTRYILDQYEVAFCNDSRALEANLGKVHYDLIIMDSTEVNKNTSAELCRTIRAHRNAELTPVIFLTSEVDNEEVEMFFELGIDSFLERPFNASLLKAAATGLIEKKEKIEKRLKFSENIGTAIDEDFGSQDKAFLDKALSVIKDNISNESFSLNDFADKMNVCRSVLNLRMQSLTGMSPIGLLRKERMLYAAKLLNSGKYNITEVGYMCGFAGPQYFSTSFKKYFNMTPREYVNGQKSR